MTNRIQNIRILQDLRDPTEPVIWIGVIPEFQSASTELKGRLMGPRCRYSSTVEVAYPLLAAPQPPQDFPALARRVIIPEACLWDPVSPFLYQGPVELWEESQCCDQRLISLGLRTIQSGPMGLRINGKAFTIKEIERDSLTELEALRLREQGYNTLIVPGEEVTASLWEIADQVGFFVITKMSGEQTGLPGAGHRPSRLECPGIRNI